MNIKGASLLDLVFVGAGFLTLSITIILMTVLLTNFNNEWQSIDEVPTVAKDIINTGLPRYFAVFDNTFLFLAVGSAISLFFGAAMLRTNPIFFLIGSLLLAVIVLISMFIRDTYNAIASSNPLAAAQANYTIIPFVMGNLTTITVVTGFLIIIGLYMKVKQSKVDI